MSDKQITIIAENFETAALEFHRRNLSDEGYRMVSPISTTKIEKLEGPERHVLFEGKPMYMVTFVKSD